MVVRDTDTKMHLSFLTKLFAHKKIMFSGHFKFDFDLTLSGDI